MPIAYAIEDLEQGWSPKCESAPSPSDDEWGVIKTSAVMPMEYIQHENKRLPDSLDPRPQFELRANDVLITRAGPRSRAAIACLVRETRPKLMVCDKVYRIRCAESVVMPAYLEIVLNAPQCVTVLDEMKTGISDSGVNLTQTKFRELLVPIPSLEEQSEIVQRVEELLACEPRVEAALASSEAELTQLDQSILAKAFRGELIPQDSGDEPASQLLHRIRTTREKLEAEKKASKKKRAKKSK